MGSTDSPELTKKQDSGSSMMSSQINPDVSKLLSSVFNGGVPQQSVVGFNPYQQQTMSGLQALYAQPNALTTGGSNYLSDVLSGKYLNPASNPNLQASGDAMTSMSNQNLNRNLDSISSGFQLMGGGGGSAAANAKMRSAVDANTGLSSALAALYGGAYQNERGIQQQALYPAMSYAQDPTQRALGALQLGGQQQQLAQLQANMPFQNFQNLFGFQNQALGTANSSLNALANSYYQPMYGPSEFSQNFGMAVQGANAAANLTKAGAAAYTASDRRLKKNIVREGIVAGLPWYSFEYVDHPKLFLPRGRHVGFMADEVEKVMPDAVHIEDGYKMVDYAMALGVA